MHDSHRGLKGFVGHVSPTDWGVDSLVSYGSLASHASRRLWGQGRGDHVGSGNQQKGRGLSLRAHTLSVHGGDNYVPPNRSGPHNVYQSNAESHAPTPTHTHAPPQS